MEKKGFNEADWILKSLAYNVRKLQKKLARPNIDEKYIEMVSLETNKAVDQLDKNPELKKEINKKIKDIHKNINDEDFGLYLARKQLENCANFINVLRKSDVKDRKVLSDTIHNATLSIYFAGSLFVSPYETIKSLRELKPLAETGKKLKACGGKNRLTEDRIEQERKWIQDFVNDLMQRRNELSFTSALELAAKEFKMSLSTIKRRGIKKPA